MSLEETLHDWHPREIAALKRATTELELKQPKKKHRKRRPGVYWHKTRKVWAAHAVINRKRYYAGSSPDYLLAVAMSEALEKRLLNQ